MQTRAVVYKRTEGGLKGEYELKETFECPQVDEGSVVVKIKACGLDLIRNRKILEDMHLLAGQEQPVGADISGVVTQVGSGVTRVSVGDEVVGVVPLSSESAGCSMNCVLSEYDLVSKPEKVGHVDAAACIGDGIKAYTGLFYQAHVCGGETVLIMDGASSFGLVAIQLVQSWGAKVLTTAASEEEVLLLESLQPHVGYVIDMREGCSLVDTCMEETGGLGVDCIIDNGVTLYSEDFTEHAPQSKIHGTAGHGIPTKHDLLSCLAVGGRWVTSQADLQLDPPDCQLMYLKGASLSFLFEHTWTLSRGQHGRYLHILADIMEKLANSLIRPVVHHTVSLDDACKALQSLHKQRVGKVVVTM
ncbi:predicted protein [Nematostella vectensis]|uniref:Enoyl reductase (ER) domain-containing protein n=1 Tax=Nematostella vectensis TaxID=45351 RepID=A7SCF3_NEMVE|nr:predicted protein [Nematostella vectensis]|eukprot:XP_001630629.1 predicted protein [Nematostella vectensis]